MKTRLDSFSGRLTRTVVITVLVTMTIISVFVFLVAASGILVFSRAHYSDILEKANRDLALAMSKVEISADNIIDEQDRTIIGDPNPDIYGNIHTTLSYYLPIQSTYLQGLTIFGNVTNLFTITKYLGSNPDCAIAGGILTQGIDSGLLGRGRSFSLGVNINL